MTPWAAAGGTDHGNGDLHLAGYDWPATLIGS